ncbi:MAG: heme ABC transporter ATP-binding protein [Flectobacillus sp.]|uniref:heme ABC transporter ATP-binding protein n=1 Tax=Flectobacillus sp. TaxID=50419 RepID=UPI003B98FD70
MIEVQNINYSINKRQLLSQVSFDFPSGKLLAIMGANGAGKSTLLKILSKELPYQEGKIRLAHRNLNTYRSDELAQIRAVLAQQNTLAFEFKVDDLVMMGRYPHFTSRPNAQDRAIVEYCLNQTGIAHLANRTVHTLSGGEQQRVYLAKVMAQLLDYESLFDKNYRSKQPKYLFLDEPVTGLDLFHQQQLLTTVKELTHKGFSVVAILHDLNLAMQFADSVLLLKKGKIVDYGVTQKVLQPDSIHETFGIQVKLFQDSQLDYPFIIPFQENIYHKTARICQV